MPGFDGTGPWGAGPMTGGGRGFCYTAGVGRGWFGRGGRRGFGRGRGRGFGMGRGFGWRWASPYHYYDAPYVAPTPMGREQEIDFLQNQAKAIKDELEDIEARLSELQQKES